MPITIVVQNDIHRSPFIKLDNEQFHTLWSFLRLPITAKGGMYGLKIRKCLGNAIIRDGGISSVKMNELITSMDILKYLGSIVDAAMEREEKVIWYEH